MHRGKYRFFRWLLLVIAIMQLIACGKLTHSAPNITSADNATFYINIPGSFTITTTGYPVPTFSVTGTLPTGVTFDASSGTLSGTPASGSIGAYPLTITASNGTSPDATQNFTLTVTSTQVLIVNDGTTDSIDNSLSTIVSNLGFSPVIIPATSITSYNLGDFRQVWDVQAVNADLSSSNSSLSTLYESYVEGGGTLVLIGGNNTSYLARNTSIINLIVNLGGTSFTVVDASNTVQTVLLSTFNQPYPNSGGQVVFSSAAGDTSGPVSPGEFITGVTNSGPGTAIFYDRNTLSVPGRLLVVFDIDYFMNPQNLTYNMVVLP